VLTTGLQKVSTQLEASRPAPQVVNTLKPRHRVPRARDSIQRTNPESRRITQFECPNLSKKKWPVLRSTASQTQLGFQSALILQRLRGQGYGDSPDAVFHSFSTAHINNRLSDTIECSQPLPKNSNPKFSTLSMQKHYPTPEWCAGCSQPLVGVMTTSQHVYEVRSRKDHRGVDLISDALPFGRLL
jgi:hypothetical protein